MSPSPPILQPLPAALQSALSARFPDGAPGAALGIWHRGQSYAGGAGLASLSAGLSFTPQTRFRACSITKQLVALLLLQLAAEGALSLDDSPDRYLPQLRSAGFDPRLTLWQLAQMRSGLPDYWCVAMLTGAQPEKPFPAAAGAALIQRLALPMFPPGAGTRYSNGNFRILQWVLEAVSGQSLADLLQARIFAPLGMTDSCLGEDTAQPLPDGTRGYRALGSAWEEEHTAIVWSGDAGLLTTLADLLRWEAAMLGIGDVRLAQSDQLALARPRPDGSRASYAFGVNAWQSGSRRMQWHSGALRGFRMMHLRFPDDGAAVVILLNRTENPMPHALAFAQLLGLEPAWDRPAPGVAAGPDFPTGAFFCATLDLVAELAGSAAAPTLNLGMDAQPLRWTGERELVSADGFTQVQVVAEGLQIQSRSLGFAAHFAALPAGDARPALAGRRFISSLLESVVEFAADGCTLCFSGPHGRSLTYALRSLGGGLLAFDCPRALDEPPPGRFHLRIVDDGLRFGCLLASGPALHFVAEKPVQP